MALAMSNGEKSDILSYIQKFPDKPLSEVARHFARSESAIRELIAKLKPTTALAHATLLARASELIDKVIDKADVDQIIDLLQRPNVGVLAPMAAKGGGSSTNVGLFVSVSPSNLPAIDASTYQDGKHLPVETVDDRPSKRIRVGTQQLGEFND